jgi:hypothetical protein
VCGGGGVASQPMSTDVLYTGAQINFEDLIPYLTYGIIPQRSTPCPVSLLHTGPGAQVFFFPDENHPLSAAAALPPSPPSHPICSRTDPMTQSMYVGRANEDEDKMSEEDSEDDLESFCILGEEEGSGIVPSTGEPAIRVLCPEGVQVDSAVLRIRDVTIPDPGSDFFPSRILDPNCLNPGSSSKNLSFLTPPPPKKNGF